MRRGILRVGVAAGLAVTVAVLAATVGTSAAPASGEPDGNLIGLHDAVTYEHNAAYTSTFTHTGKTQTHLQYHNPIPENGDGDQATLVYASCQGTLTSTEFVCDPVQLKKGEQEIVTLVWEAFADGSSAGCDATPCMTNAGTWVSDAGTNAPQKLKKIHDVGPVETPLLEGDDDARAATYALGACDPEADPTLATNPDLGEANPLATIVCIPGFTPPSDVQPGLVGDVEERDVDESSPEGAVGQGSHICIAAEECTSPFLFEDRISFAFLIDELTFFPGFVQVELESPVTQVFHDGDPVLSCDDEENPDADPCVESIESDGLGTTTVVATGSDNGSWDFG